MFKHFSSQGHVRKNIFHESHENLEGNFYEAFLLTIYAHNAHTQLNNFFSSPFFSLPSFSKPERDGLCHKNSRMRNTQGKSSHFTTTFFLSFFSGYSKKKSATNVCVCIHQNVCGETHERNENENVEKRFFLGYSCVPRNERKKMRENEKKKLKNVHRPQIAGYSW
jgi:hypothetical protein